MSISNNLKKIDVKFIAKELGKTVSDNAKICDIKKLIEDNDLFKMDQNFVRGVIKSIVEDRTTTEAYHQSEIAEVRASPFTPNVYAVAGLSEQSSDSPNSPLNELIALRSEIAALSKQVVRLSRDRSRNRSRRRCGHLVTQQGTKLLPDKVELILNFPKPKTIKELQRFLGILNFYRRFLPNVAQYQIALSEFLKGTRKNDNRVIEWTTQAEQDFCTCKKLIADATLLAHPKPDAELILDVDASDFAIGGALFQIIDNEPQPLAFFSRKLSQTEKNSSANDRELLASYASNKHFIHMLEARDFKLFTDHKPLTHAFKQRLDKCSPRQARQLDFISQFTTNICYLPGNKNITADILSRIASIEMPNPINYDEIAKSQESDLELQNLISNPQGLQLKKIVMPNSNIPLFCDLSTGTARPYIPKEYRQRIFSQLHNVSPRYSSYYKINSFAFHVVAAGCVVYELLLSNVVIEIDCLLHKPESVS
ncbi:retrovirus-related Pol polyprotein from transposon 17.6 [Nephila pilipes]|uniref:RNA-directed DNA polymerase n=1 Tax=Nephila pilipes TaxID=299642 RepID=A0A8X6TPY5_NEPPI|nr:retrovirus-related Pol polyprotein from transposon 17.6 [Nephila pilipes]